MGQRLMQLNNTFNVADNGQITLHVAQLPPNPNIIQPGPVLVFVVIHGVPSNGTMAIVGNGQISTQLTAPASVLPSSVLSSNNAIGSASPSTTDAGGAGSTARGGRPSTGVIIAAAVGGLAAIGIAAMFAGVLIARRRRAAAARNTIMGGITRSTSMGRGYRDMSDSSAGVGFNEYSRGSTGSGDAFIPLQQYSQSDLHAAPDWTPSQTSLHYGGPPGAGAAWQPAPAAAGYGGHVQGDSPDFDPYEQRQVHGQGHPRYL